MPVRMGNGLSNTDSTTKKNISLSTSQRPTNMCQSMRLYGFTIPPWLQIWLDCDWLDSGRLTHSWTCDHNSDGESVGNPRSVCGLTTLRFRLSVTLFSNPYRLSPKVTWALRLINISYALCLILCLMSNDLMALNYFFFLGLRVLDLWSRGSCQWICLVLTCHSLRILVPFEALPHL